MSGRAGMNHYEMSATLGRILGDALEIEDSPLRLHAVGASSVWLETSDHQLVKLTVSFPRPLRAASSVKSGDET